MKKLLAILGIVVSCSANAELLDMVPLSKASDGNTIQVERFMWEYGSKSDNWKYLASKYVAYDVRGNLLGTGTIYVDCSDATYGFSTPTTEDVVPGTAGYFVYEKACVNKEVKRVY